MDLHRAFLDDIIANPEDNTPRLIYADWLDDQGNEARAEFIRLQIALATGTAGPDGVLREEQLLRSHVLEWAGPWADDNAEVLFRRGFLEGVALDGTGRWQRRLPELARRDPLRLIRIATHEPEPLVRIVSLIINGSLNLTSLDVQMNHALGPDWFALLPTASRASCLRSLLLEHETADGWDNILSALAHAPDSLAHLTELGLAFGTSNPPLRAETIEAFIHSNTFPNLTRFHIPFSWIGEEALAFLAESPRWTNLTHLDLGCCHGPLAGWERFVAGPNTPRLHWLGLIGAHVDLDEGWETLRMHSLGERLRSFLDDRADFDTSATFPRWRGRKL